MYKILANTQNLGKDVVYLTECHSTNDVALEFIRSGKASHGMVFWTQKQTKGKGQRGNSWFSEPDKNLTFSIVLKHSALDVSSIFLLNVAVSLAVHAVLREFIDSILIKWPNDFVDAKKGKIGGMLIENSISGHQVEYSVIGLGINVNQSQFPFPGATSLSLLANREFSLESLIQDLLLSMETNYMKVVRGEVSTLLPAYLNHLYRFQQWAMYDDGAAFEGKIVGVSSDGRLLVQKQNGETHRYSLKSIKFL
ncbi:MAG: biotin--[acetyl-CoA-carboxylase] ligase [Lunatimonas sp.]|uniref:biotin--[acetyl-CoA-carboxylase] ligase n=1 Tax=Lunatimonas sp. TaxID=2060141 RepID=UPI00263AE79E|nr:biotin--[acetyl-CoA-carboxylase] ligase [Lunatimonas sp.]MCC5937896.1 biotin--[acetyl-CoA-carboxylase] ligase [Lunatimonas sp.]